MFGGLGARAILLILRFSSGET